jgi:hypothetical protein
MHAWVAISHRPQPELSPLIFESLQPISPIHKALGTREAPTAVVWKKQHMLHLVSEVPQHLRM